MGRHAILAALEQQPNGGGESSATTAAAVERITVLTRFPELLHETNWNSGCPEPMSYPKDPRVTVVKIDSWETDNIEEHVKDATAVVSCLGNRQPGYGHWEAEEGNKALLKALPQDKKNRVVVLTSVGVEEDWPPMEFIGIAKIILSILFIVPGLSRGAYRDLTKMERAYRSTEPDKVDYLFVRPVGLGEDVVPVGKWWLQKKKNKDVVGGNMAKLDCARFMVSEALEATRHREAVVIGSDPAVPLK